MRSSTYVYVDDKVVKYCMLSIALIIFFRTKMALTMLYDMHVMSCEHNHTATLLQIKTSNDTWIENVENAYDSISGKFQ